MVNMYFFLKKRNYLVTYTTKPPKNNEYSQIVAPYEEIHLAPGE